MSWTTGEDLRAQVLKLWEKGIILSELAGAESSFPYKLKFKGPTSKEMTTLYFLVKNWAENLRKWRRIRIVEKEINHQILGRNSLPSEVWIDSAREAVEFIKKGGEMKKFIAVVEFTHYAHPELVPWLQKYPMRALAVESDWQDIMKVVGWLKKNPESGIYIRQMDLPGIHTKFVEKHQKLLGDLMAAASAPQAVDPNTSTSKSKPYKASFAERHGFNSKPSLVRFRVLDDDRKLLPGDGQQDMSLDLDSFARLNLRFSKVFITENEINYLSFPSIKDSLAIFGKGFGIAEVLSKADWLAGNSIYYWGDIDTHGFSILNQARSIVPTVKSLLMDAETLQRHHEMLVEEHTAKIAELNFLTVDEKEVYASLTSLNGFSHARLEQEKLNWQFACKKLEQVSLNGILDPMNNRKR